MRAWNDIDVLVSLNQEGYDKHIGELRPGGVVLYDSTSATPTREEDDDLLYGIPVDELARSIDFVRGRNLIMIGAMVQLFGLPLDKAEQMVRRRLGRFKDLLPKNLEALNLGYNYASEHFTRRPPIYLEPPLDSGRGGAGTRRAPARPRRPR